MLKKLTLLFVLVLFGCSLQAQSDKYVMSSTNMQPYAASPTFGGNVTLQDNEHWIGYWDGDTSNLLSIGYGETPAKYSACISFDSGNYVTIGKTIEGVRFVLADTKNIESLYVWLSTSLPHTPQEADICCQAVTNPGPVTEVRFDKPSLPEDRPWGFCYVGYTVTISGGAGEADLNPILVAGKPTRNSFYSSINDYGWYDYSLDDIGTLAMQALISGDFNERDAAFRWVLEDVTTETTSTQVPVYIENTGLESIKNMDVTITAGNQEKRQVIDLSQSAPRTGEMFKAIAQAEVPDLGNAHAYTATIHAINGVPLDVPITSNEGYIYAISQTFPHKVLFEECTGMWCTFCSRGCVALEKIKQVYGDDVVRVSIHDGDDLTSEEFEQLDVGSYPSACLDRNVYGLCPYFGSDGSNFGIAHDIDNRAKVLAVAQVKSIPYIEGDIVTVKSETLFGCNIDQVPFRLGYALIEDGMEDPSYYQSNYLSGETQYLELDPLFAPWVEASPLRKDVVFDDVAVAAMGYVFGIENSLPSSVEKGKAYTHEVKFDLSKYPLIKDRTKLKAVVILLSSYLGEEVINADVQPVTEHTGIQSVETDDAPVTEMMRYAIDGRQLTAPQRGINVVRYSKRNNPERNSPIARTHIGMVRTYRRDSPRAVSLF